MGTTARRRQSVPLRCRFRRPFGTGGRSRSGKSCRGWADLHWRTCEPLVRSRRELQERNSVRWIDLMGLTGVTLEAARDPAWAAKLSNEEARRATEFATLEINGFPRWLSDLGASHPAEVRTVLHQQITDELTHEGVTFFETLQAVAYSNDGLASLLAPVLLQDLEAGLSLPHSATSAALQILVNGLARNPRENGLTSWVSSSSSRRRMLRWPFSTWQQSSASVRYRRPPYSSRKRAAWMRRPKRTWSIDSWPPVSVIRCPVAASRRSLCHLLRSLKS